MQKLFDGFQVTKQHRSNFVEIIPAIRFSTFPLQQNSFNPVKLVLCFKYLAITNFILRQC